MSSSKGFSWPRDRTYISHGSCIAGRFFTAEPPGNSYPPLSICCCSSSSVMSDSLSPHGLQQARLPCLSLTPRVCANSCPSSWWCNPTISSSVIPFSSCLQSFPASRSFPMSWVFASGGQRIGASASVLPMNIQGWFILGLTGLISLLSNRLSRNFSSTIIRKHQFFTAQPSLWSNFYFHTWLLEKPYLWQTFTQTFVGKVMSLVFKMLSRLVIAFLPRSKHLLISWLQLPSEVILEPKKIKSVSASTFTLSICY